MTKENTDNPNPQADGLPTATNISSGKTPLQLVSYFTREQYLHSMNIIIDDPGANDVTKSRKLLEIQNRLLLDLRDLLFDASPIQPINVVVPDLAQAAADSIKPKEV